MDDKRELIKAILSSHDIKMNISGCGCCGSPTVSFSYRGDVIVQNADDFNLQMFSEDVPKNQTQSHPIEVVEEFIRTFYEDTPTDELEKCLRTWETFDDASLRFTTKEGPVLWYSREVAIKALKRIIGERA